MHRPQFDRYHAMASSPPTGDGPVRVLLRAIVIPAAIALAWPASVALAQANPGAKSASSAAPAKEQAVPGVVVQAPSKSSKIPPQKRAAYEREAAKRKAWKNYRAGGASPSGKASDAGASASTYAENYPGLGK